MACCARPCRIWQLLERMDVQKDGAVSVAEFLEYFVGGALATTKADDKLVKAHKLAVHREMETKVKTAEESAAEWREKFEQERDALRDKTEEMEAMERVTKRAKRGEVVIVEDGCFLVAAPGSEVFLTQQGADKLPVPLALPAARPAQIVIPGMPATMPQF